MAQIIGLPKLSPTMEEGVLVKWVKKEGDAVVPGDLVAEVETDKANMDFNIEDKGTLLKILVKEGDTVKLGAPVAILGKPGEDVSALLAQASAPSPASPVAASAANTAAAAPAPVAPPAGVRIPPAPPTEAPQAAPAVAQPSHVPTAPVTPQPAPRTGAILASPLAKTLAVELGIDLRTLAGSGPGGRIVERDVRAAATGGTANAAATSAVTAQPAPSPGAASAAAENAHALAIRAPSAPALSSDEFVEIPASNMRKRIAARLTEAKRDVPHFYLQRAVDAAALLGFRQKLNELLGDRGKVSVNDLIVKACALALRRVPECNASWDNDAIKRFQRVHIGIAVAIEDGLVTPVVRDADLKGIGAIAAEVRDLADRAKSRALKGHEIAGSTFTVSNLGMFGIERFTAIINPPEAAILAVGAVIDAAVVRNGQVVAGKQMMLSLSCDHRVIDGALGAKWLAAVVDLLEHPESLAL